MLQCANLVHSLLKLHFVIRVMAQAMSQYWQHTYSVVHLMTSLHIRNNNNKCQLDQTLYINLKKVSYWANVTDY